MQFEGNAINNLVISHTEIYSFTDTILYYYIRQNESLNIFLTSTELALSSSDVGLYLAISCSRAIRRTDGTSSFFMPKNSKILNENKHSIKYIFLNFYLDTLMVRTYQVF